MSEDTSAREQGHFLTGLSANHFAPPLPVNYMQIAQETINSQEKARIIMEMTQQQYLEQPPPANEATSDGKGQEPAAPPEASHATANPPFPEPSPSRPRKRPAAKSLLRRIGLQFLNKSQANASEDINQDVDRGDKSEKPATIRRQATTRPLPTSKLAQKKATKSGKSANKKPVEKKATVTKNTQRLAPEPVWVGTPTEDLEGGWPTGWTKKVFERKSGATKGGKDRYWYSPINGFKLRSMVEGAYANIILFYFHLLDC
jgi:hypothetical protein